MRDACSAMIGRKRSRAAGIALGASLQRLDEAAQRSERRPELMARIGDEIGPHLVDALDFGQVAEQYEDIDGAVRLASSRQGSDRCRHAAADGNALGIGHGHRAAKPGRGRDGIEEFRRPEHRGDVTAFAQRCEQAARLGVAEPHMAARAEQDDRVGKRFGQDAHGGDRRHRRRGGLKRGRQRLIGIVPWQEDDRGDETEKADQGEGLGETGDEHERQHDDAHGDDHPERRREARPDLAERPQDGLPDPPKEARGNEARFCSIAQCASRPRNESPKPLRDPDVCPWIITFLRRFDGFDVWKMTKGRCCRRSLPF